MHTNIIIVTFYKNQFIILDAKYYKLHFDENNLSGQPGLESITKQYLYELAFNEFIKNNEFIGVKNAFLLPKYDGEIENGPSYAISNLISTIINDTHKILTVTTYLDGEIENVGIAKLEILSDLYLEDIQIIMIPAGKINQYYWDNKKLSIKKLDL